MNRVHITSDEAGLRLALTDGRASLRLVPRLGLRLPRYHFRLGRVVHAAAELGLFRLQTTLLLGNPPDWRWRPVPKDPQAPLWYPSLGVSKQSLIPAVHP